MVRTTLVSLLAAVVVPAHASAQLYTVAINDPAADFASLADALAAVPPGATLLIGSDMPSEYSYAISFDVSIVGVPGAGSGDGGHPLIPSPIEIYDARVSLSRLTIRSHCDYDGIAAFGVTRLHLDQCEVYAGCEHDGISAFDDSRVMLDACYVWSTGFDGLYSNKTLVVGDGAVVCVKDCLIESQDPKYAAYVAGQLFHSTTTFVGDLTISGAGVETVLDDTLDADSATFHLGQVAAVHGKAAGAAWLLVGVVAVRTPVDLHREAPLLIEFPLTIVPVAGDSNGAWTISDTIPADDELIGASIFFQQFDLQLLKLSCVDAAIIGA